MKRVLIVPALLSALAVPVMVTGCGGERAVNEEPSSAKPNYAAADAALANKEGDALYDALLAGTDPKLVFEEVCAKQKNYVNDPAFNDISKSIITTALSDTFNSKFHVKISGSNSDTKYAQLSLKLWDMQDNPSTAFSGFLARRNVGNLPSAKNVAVVGSKPQSNDGNLRQDEIPNVDLTETVRQIKSDGIQLTDKVTPSAWSKVDAVEIKATGLFVDGDTVLVYGPESSAFSTDSGESWHSQPSGAVNGWCHDGKGYSLSSDGEIRSWDGFSYSVGLDLPTIYGVFPTKTCLYLKSKSKIIILNYQSDGSFVQVAKVDSTEATKLYCVSRNNDGVIGYDSDTKLAQTVKLDGSTSTAPIPVSTNPNFMKLVKTRATNGGTFAPVAISGYRLASSYRVNASTVINEAGQTAFNNDWFKKSDAFFLGISDNFSCSYELKGDKRTASIYIGKVRHPASDSIPDGSKCLGANDKRIFAVGTNGIFIVDAK